MYFVYDLIEELTGEHPDKIEAFDEALTAVQLAMTEYQETAGEKAR